MIFKKQFNLTGLDPICEEIALTGPVKMATVIRFSFEEQLKALFNDHNVWNADIIVHDPSDRFGRYQNSRPVVELMDGKW